MGRKNQIPIALILIVILSSVSLSGCFDESERSEWAYEKTQIKAMNDAGYKGKGVTIGIVDTGVNLDHPDLRSMNVVAWIDYVNDNPEPYDDGGHGTHVAGIMAADGEMSGAAPDADYVVAKALSGDGDGDDGTVADAIDWCVDQGADVICLSLGGPAILPRLGEESGLAARDAINQGVVVVSAAGNDEEDPNDGSDVQRPANVDQVIAVGAVDEDLKIARFSESGDNDGITPLPFDDRQDPDKKPEVVAPGVEIRSTSLGDTYAIMSGTSQATPFVASGIALVLEANPQYKRDGSSGGNSNAVETIKEAVMRGAYATQWQDTPHDDRYGYGLFRAAETSANL